jgi:hypothetical protein
MLYSVFDMPRFLQTGFKIGDARTWIPRVEKAFKIRLFGHVQGAAREELGGPVLGSFPYAR